MKKTLLLSIAALAMSACMASAQGINFSLNDCGTFGVQNTTNNCATNSGSAMICYGSVIAPPNVNRMVAMEAVVDAQTIGATLSPWWQMNTGECRPTALSLSADFSANSSCVDYWQGQAIIVGGVDAAHAGPNRFRVKVVAALPAEQPITTDETYMFKVTISKTKSTGTGSCAGCLDAASLVLNEIRLDQPAGVGDYRIFNPANRAFVTYNGGVPGTPGVVPTQNKTWGQVKALYR